MGFGCRFYFIAIATIVNPNPGAVTPNDPDCGAQTKLASPAAIITDCLQQDTLPVSLSDEFTLVTQAEKTLAVYQQALKD